MQLLLDQIVSISAMSLYRKAFCPLSVLLSLAVGRRNLKRGGDIGDAENYIEPPGPELRFRGDRGIDCILKSKAEFSLRQRTEADPHS